jgi:hypothetical protein
LWTVVYDLLTLGTSLEQSIEGGQKSFTLRYINWKHPEKNIFHVAAEFAVVEEQRVEWMRHHESNHGVLPTQAEIKTWYEQQPSSVLLRAKGTAENSLQTYSNEVLALVDEQQRKEIEDGIVVGEIRAMNRFWPQFGVNLAGGFASAILFAALLTLIAFLVLNEHSPVEIGSKFKPKVEDSQNVKKIGSD